MNRLINPFRPSAEEFLQKLSSGSMILLTIPKEKKRMISNNI